MKNGIVLTIPGMGEIRLQSLLLDYNGTLACDGKLLPGITPRLATLAEILRVEVITADTFGSVQRALDQAGIGDSVAVHILPSGGGEAASKRERLRTLGVAQTCAIGNGRNDRLMLQEAALSIGLLGKEGLCVPALLQAHIVCADINDALDLLIRPKRCIATLRE